MDCAADQSYRRLSSSNLFKNPFKINKLPSEGDIFNICIRGLSLLITSILVTSCSSVSNRPDVHDLATQAAIKLARPSLEKIFFAQAPIALASRNMFGLVERPPGNEFDLAIKVRPSISYNEKGNLVLAPGDYVIPVMTYCMSSNGSSPDGHQYILSQMAGPMARVVREINLKSLPKFSPRDVQILSWSIQNGLSYEEMTSESRRIVDEIIPDLKAELKRSFLERFTEDWNQVAGKSQGLIPSFDVVTDEFLEELGEVGNAIIKIREFRRVIKNSGNDYSKLSRLIHLPGQSSVAGTLWSKISENVYARFITEGHFQEIGQIQIRVLAPTLKRGVSSIEQRSRVEVDLSSWIADPKSTSIQPLSFSALYGFAGTLILPEVAANPILMGMLFGAILASQPVDWNAFYEMSKLAKENKNPAIRRMIDQGTLTLHKAHDELERPARELGVIDRKTKNTTKDEKNSTRQYEKPGGEKLLQKDFDKFPGEVTSLEPGVDMKTLPNGSKVVKRPASKNETPTLEIQPEKIGNKIDDRRRIKVRYPKE